MVLIGAILVMVLTATASFGAGKHFEILGLEIHCTGPNAPDNYGAGATAAINLYAGLKKKILAAKSPIRIGEVNPDAMSESITSRGLGFIDKICELAKADGKKVAVRSGVM